jgi:hypothetical protein
MAREGGAKAAVWEAVTCSTFAYVIGINGVMVNIKAAKKAASADRRERIGDMEPMLITEGSRFRPELTELAFELSGKAAGFRRSLPSGISVSLSELVRSMNCYYSNLIEGHDTHPVEIERALKGEYSDNIKERNLQLEAKAHIAVQRWIEDGNLRGRVTTREGICEVYRRFCAELPKDLLWVEKIRHT